MKKVEKIRGIMQSKGLYALIVLMMMATVGFTQAIPEIEGPPTVGSGITPAQVYTTDALKTNYVWTVSSAGKITADDHLGTITVRWTNPLGNQFVQVIYDEAKAPGVLAVLYYPFPDAIDPTTIPKFVEPVPHFAAGLRVNAKAGGILKVETKMVRQVALSTGTVLLTGTIGASTPEIGKGNYAAYQVTYNGVVGPAMWPAQTIETKQGAGVVVNYVNGLVGAKYSDFNILADQTLMMNGYPQNGNIHTDPYTGDIPMSVHLHGGEMPSNSDGGPTAWFMPTGNPLKGPGFKYEASSMCTYPNMQEGTTLWYHPHDQGLTRINVYTGLAGFYFLRGAKEDALHLPGWSGDGKVMENTPAGKQPTFNGKNTYLPEIELAIQDRMFNVKGELYWPVAPTNPEVNPYWTPEFFGDVMTVNGKSWPYLSVAPRKYAFRILDGCNARFLNMWLSSDPSTGVHDGPALTIIQSEGGLLDVPIRLDGDKTLFLAPAERPTVIIDFSKCADGTVFYLMNDANAPYPGGDPVQTGLTDRIMQFVVNGTNVTPDNSKVPNNLRPNNEMIKLTDFAGKLNVTPTVKRRLILNEVSGAGGPLMVAINNSHFDTAGPTSEIPNSFGGPTEIPTEGSIELWEVANTTVDAHPMHIHLTQWQLVSRRKFDADAYMEVYSKAWATNGKGYPNYPLSASYPGGSGSPYDYNTASTDGYLGGNPMIPESMFRGAAEIPLPEERGWKDAIKALPGEVSTYIARYAPTDKPLNAPPLELVYPFDPSLGPGYVWHCHIIDHEDMDMMRPLVVKPSAVRCPVITADPADLSLCLGLDAATFKVVAYSLNQMSYQWQVSSDAGKTWKDLTNGILYKNVLTPAMKISVVPLSFNNLMYRCKLKTNVGPEVYSNAATLKVSPRPIVLIIPSYPDRATLILKALTISQGNNTYLWTPGNATTQNITLNNSNSGLYSVTTTNAFGCSSFPAFYNVKWRISELKSGLLNDPSAMAPSDLGTNLKVYPNPFTDKLYFEFSFETDTHAMLEIFNVAGARMEKLYDANIDGNQLYTIEYLPRLTQSQTVIYRLTLGDKTYTGKLIYQQK